MFMADTVVQRWTRADLERLPDDGNRYEVLDGALFVTPLPSWDHQDIVAELLGALRGYGRMHEIAVASAPGSVVWNNNELQPDIVMFEGTRSTMKGRAWSAMPTPLLVVEVESGSTRQRDRSVKRAAYIESLRIPEYWLVDPQAQTVRVHRGDARTELLKVGQILRWSPEPSVEPFEIPLNQLFHSVDR